MENRRNYYRILQVQCDAPPEIIRASYRTIMRELKQHPDLGGDQWNACVINEAYETLSDNVKRAEYDRKYFNHYLKKILPEKRYQTSENLKSENNGKDCHRICRRLINRVKINETQLYYFARPQNVREAKILDLSTKGIRFNCSEKLPHGSTINIECLLFKARAEVVNSQINLMTDKPTYSVGARFLSINFRGPRGLFYSKFV
jgi:curved DNA-binding protein CbpA